MSLIRSSLLLGAGAAAAGGLQVSRSLRFNSADSAYLNRTPGSAGNRKTWSWSAWVKRSALGSTQALMSVEGNSDSTTAQFWFSSDDKFRFGIETADIFITNAVFRDCSAWYHFLLTFDATNATSADKIILYVNGARQTTSTYTAPSNTDYGFNRSGAIHSICRRQNNADWYFNGYVAQAQFIDGQQLTPASFAETDATTGQWIPKAYSGSYGTNGFYLQFADNSSNTASTLGKDSSPNGNNWTPVNFSVSTTSTTYTPASNTNLYGMTWAQIFDANNSAGVYSLDNTLATGTLAISKSYSSSVELLCCSTNSSAPIYANGVAVSSPPGGNNFSSAQWRTVLSGSGTLTSVGVQSDGAQRGILFQVRVDGVQLVNISAAGNDSLVDSPTNYGTDTGVGGTVRGNYCTFNPLDLPASGVFSNGNMEFSHTGGGGVWRTGLGTIALSSGKWYWEMVPTVIADAMIGIVKSDWSPTANSSQFWDTASGYGYLNNGQKYNNGSGAAYGASFTTNDVIGIALDLDAGTLVFYKNGASQGTAYSSLSGTFKPAFGAYQTCLGIANFGQRAFAYTAPSGYKALCTQNLPAPLVTKSNTVMDVLTWTGTGGSRTLTGLGFSPDLVWGKARSAAGYNHQLYDVIRGTGSTKDLSSSLTAAEGSATTDAASYGYLSSFTSDGFDTTSGSVNNAYWNGSGTTYVAWSWDAGTSTVSNTQGSITSQVRANPTAGFSVVTYQANAPNNTIGHGLGIRPEFVITKARTRNDNWLVYHSALGVDKWLHLNITAAAINTSGIWGTSGNWTSNTFGVSTNSIEGNNYGSNDFVAYCFSSVVGYSNAFSYNGNGSSDGPMVYLGFRPRLILLKVTNTTGPWYLFDTARNTYNVMNNRLEANSSSAEASDRNVIDALSNGFKLRDVDAVWNQNGNTYVGFAWAESPFNYSRAR